MQFRKVIRSLRLIIRPGNEPWSEKRELVNLGLLYGDDKGHLYVLAEQNLPDFVWESVSSDIIDSSVLKRITG